MTKVITVSREFGSGGRELGKGIRTENGTLAIDLPAFGALYLMRTEDF